MRERSRTGGSGVEEADDVVELEADEAEVDGPAAAAATPESINLGPTRTL